MSKFGIGVLKMQYSCMVVTKMSKCCMSIKNKKTFISYYFWFSKNDLDSFYESDVNIKSKTRNFEQNAKLAIKINKEKKRLIILNLWFWIFLLHILNQCFSICKFILVWLVFKWPLVSLFNTNAVITELLQQYWYRI